MNQSESTTHTISGTTQLDRQTSLNNTTHVIYGFKRFIKWQSHPFYALFSTTSGIVTLEQRSRESGGSLAENGFVIKAPNVIHDVNAIATMQPVNDPWRCKIKRAYIFQVIEKCNVDRTGELYLTLLLAQGLKAPSRKRPSWGPPDAPKNARQTLTE